MSDLNPAITDEMIEIAARAYAKLEGNDFDAVSAGNRMAFYGAAGAILDAALAGRVVTGPVREHCRACRHERDEIVPAEYIVWGKFAPPDRLGPGCYDHTAEAIGRSGMSRIDQYAVFDLRPFRAAEGGEPRG